jgi:hypothetical protein
VVVLIIKGNITVQKLTELTLKQREELFRQLRVSITYHSNAMEGTTLFPIKFQVI